ncbi:MAG: hypothetical protein ACI8XO_001590 [Verrucomicrobiales bacterium]|jgi:hypothetical protein
MKKIIFPLAFAVSLTASANAAVVTSGFVQNTEANWSHVAGAVASGSTENVPSSRAIDGNYSGVWGNGSVTHTADNGDAGSWWQVDLGAARPITDIALFNRTDCCGGRLANFSVLASNDSTFTTAHIYDSGNQGAVGVSAGFTGIGATARYVRVQRNSLAPGAGGSVISLAEVDVIGAALFNYSNLAIGSAASQSTTLSNSANPTADKAIDGNLATAFGDGSTTHTAGSGGAPVFWETSLTSASSINEISLYNRGDCCPERLSNFRVSIFDGATEVWGENYFEGTGNVGNGIFSIQEDTGGFFGTGDRVRIELIGGLNNAPNDTLSLREVEIYGVAVPEPSTGLLGLAGLALLLRRCRR